MIGIFDSGVGGLNAFYEVRRGLPYADIAYLADRANAPYGTKPKDKLISLVKNDIKRLQELGCRLILIACCTASTVYPELSDDEKRISIPIITPSARVAAEGSRITVIATDATVRSRSFEREILRYNTAASITELAAQPLVAAIEGGARCENMNASGRAVFSRVCERIRDTDPDTLVLGCTHFSHLKGEFERELPSVRIVSPAAEGARALLSRYRMENLRLPVEHGRSVYL